MRKVSMIALLTIEYLIKAAIRHSSFDGWWRYRFEARNIWRTGKL
jgi:hypothetical protein